MCAFSRSRLESRCAGLVVVSVLVAIGASCGSVSSTQPPPPPPPPPTFTTTTSQEGSLLVMQNQTDTETVRIALQTNWGGSAVELSLNGTNFVNEHDTGREIQVGLWDTNLPCPCWNPTQGGDEYDNGTPTIAQTVTSDSLYTKAQALQWYPDLYGGGPTQPIASDIMMEQTVTPVPLSNRAFHLHYKITHLGSDVHPNAWQQIPVMYSNDGMNQLVYYGGTSPWTNGDTTQTEITTQLTPHLYMPERWGSLVDAQNEGMTLYVPAGYPWAYGAYFPNGGSGPTGNTTVDFAPIVSMTFTPNLVIESDAYVIVGDPQTARGVIYELHQSLGEPNISTPFGELESPTSNAVLSGMTTVSGWALAVNSVSKVEVRVDGTVDGSATYGLPRPDIPVVYPNAPVNVGFTYSLDSSKYSNGAHVLNIRVTDSSGNVAIFANRNITVSN
jgi:Bacterial Ig domain